MEKVLSSLADYYAREEDVRKSIKSAVSYPLIMIGMMFVIILVLIIKVLPMFNNVFIQLGSELSGFSPFRYECRPGHQPLLFCFYHPSDPFSCCSCLPGLHQKRGIYAAKDCPELFCHEKAGTANGHFKVHLRPGPDPSAAVWMWSRAWK